MKKLYLFNPENDMALASGSFYYMPPASAKKMAADLSTLPVWYAERESAVLLADSRQVEWLRKTVCFPLKVDGVLEIPAETFEIMPWGWSSALLHRLGKDGMRDDVEVIRKLSSRKMAVDLLPELRLENTVGESFWFTTLEGVSMFALKHGKVLLKAPWSGSGKGIQPLCGQPDDNLKGWIKRVIASQGGVVGEPFYHKVKDFAMEFSVSSGKAVFVGYSLFEADARGIYKENLLASDEAIEGILGNYISRVLLKDIRARLLDKLSLRYGTDYHGYLGVDMMVVQTEGGYVLHPCVEINVRMNMGVVARLFFDRYVSREAYGRYCIEYYPCQGEALCFHEEMKRKYPLCLHEGKIKEGYLSLTPVFEDTNYQIYVILQ